MNNETTYIDAETKEMGINSVDANTVYIHFTSLTDAQAIVDSGELRSGNWDSAYAIVEGGAFVPTVQHTELGVAANREHAVVFTTSDNPDCVFPEETVWKSGRVKLTEALVVTAVEAVELLTVV